MKNLQLTLWPGHNTPARKMTYVRKVEAARESLDVGSGTCME